MLKTVLLTDGAPVYVCDICGHAGAMPLPMCGVTPPLQTIHLKVGDRVAMWWHWGRYIRHQLWTVTKIRYAGPWYDGWVHGRQLPLHTLIVEVAQNGDGTPWTEGSTSMCSTEVSYPDFLLWQEGNEEKLRAAGLLYSPTFWERLKKLFGIQLVSIKRLTR